MRQVPLVNDVILWNDNERLDRVLWIDEGNIIAFCIDMTTKTGFPRIVKVSMIVQSLLRGDASILDNDPYARIVKEDELTESERKIRDTAWMIVSNVISRAPEPDIFSRNKRGTIVSTAATEYRITVKTVYKYLRRYWQRGRRPNSLIPDYANSGGKGKEKSVGKKKRGRPKKNANILGDGINIDESIKQIFLIAYDKYYKSKKALSLTKTYELMCEDFFIENVYFENGRKKVVLLDANERPTLNQFSYWVDKQEQKDFVCLHTARKGENWFNLRGRALLSRSDTELVGPGSLYQIDSTVGDIYLVSRFNREWIIGRPVIYAVIDAFSRMIAGLYIGLEGPSWLGAANALANCAMDKVAYCRQYGIGIEQEDWPVKGLPQAIISDRGELEGKPVETLSKNLNVWLKTTPPYRADWKGIVEQYFRLTNIKVKPLLPGSVMPDFKERGGRDYRLDAKLDLFQFTQIMILCALKHNKTIMKNFQRKEMMIADDIPAVPLVLWNWGIQNISGKLNYFPEEIVKLNLMPAGTASVTEKGIVFQGMRYSTEQAIKEAWFEKARMKGSWNEDISYDPRNMNQIYIRDPGGRSYKVCTHLDSEEVYKDKTYDEIVFLREYEKLTFKKHEQSELQEKVDLNSDIDDVIRLAGEMAPEKSTLSSKTSRVKSIKPKRKLELEAQRKEEAFVLPSNSIESNSRRSNDSKVTPLSGTQRSQSRSSNIDIFRKKQQEKLFGGKDPNE